jgi:DEAD/DEAH box helicase domain-containing protein
LRKRLPAYSEGFNVVNIVINETSLLELDSDQKEDLYSLISFSDSIKLAIVENPLSNPNHTILAQFSTDTTTWTFATRAESASRLSDTWGFTGEELVVKSKGFHKVLTKKHIDKNDLIKQKSNQFELLVSNELNGKAFDFGDTFWKVIKGASPEITNILSSSPKLKHVVYSDRYLYTPLSALLILRIVKSLSVKCSQSTPFSLNINSMVSIESRIYRRRYVSNNWMPDEENSRKETIENLNTDNSIMCKLNLTTDRKNISHARTLDISFENGSSIVIRFDQGMGCWETINYNDFPFHKNSTDQIDWLNKVGMPLLIKNSQALPTHIFVSIKNNR